MKTVALGEVATVNPRAGSVEVDEAISFVGMAQLDAATATATPLTTRPFAEVSKGYTVFEDRDILAAKITPCWENGKVGQALLKHRTGVGSTEFHVVRPGHLLDDRYLLHFLRQSSVRVTGELRMSGSAGQKRVPASFLRDLQIPLPPLDVQRRIAAILDHADALRAKRRQAVAHLNALTQATFHAMFQQVESDVELGSIIANGPTNGLYRPSSDYGSGTPILRIDGFDNGSLHDRAWKRVRISASDVRRYALAEGDIVINRVNALSHLGKSAIILGLTEPVVYESNMMRIRLDATSAVPKFVIVWLQSATAKHQILAKAKKAINQASINQRDIRELTLPLPPLTRQFDFVARSEAITRQLAAVERALAADNELFASLQSRAFRGEL